MSSKGGKQLTPFEIGAANYEENRHFFLAQFFHDMYDDWMRSLPNITSGIKINRIEVWATNKTGTTANTRNYGVERAEGDYVLILDSDVVLPEGYLQAVDHELAATPCDAFGGPDRAHASFSKMQKAINYAMTSFFTTGGIRGGKKKMDKFYPRSFNMGVRRAVYHELGVFSAAGFAWSSLSAASS